MRRSDLRNLPPKQRRRLLLAFWLCLMLCWCYRVTDPGYSVREIKEGYKGVIIDKNAARKVIGLKIRTTTGHIFDVGMLSAKLEQESAVGDSIEKIPNDNYVILSKPNGVKMKLLYLYISDDNRKDFRWPVEWKDKWKEDTTN